MTQKELLYIEDALNHELHLEIKCDDFSKKVKNSDLKEFISDLKVKSKEVFDKLLQLLD